MAALVVSVDRKCVVGDLFDSFHDAQQACSKLKAEGYPEESVLEFVQLTAKDDLEARTKMLYDLGFRVKAIRELDEALDSGKILVCVDFLEDKSCHKVARILKANGGLDWGDFDGKAKPRKARAKTRRASKKV